MTSACDDDECEGVMVEGDENCELVIVDNGADMFPPLSPAVSPSVMLHLNL